MTEPRPRALLLAIFAVALAMRVAPAWQGVYGDGGVDLQGRDPYYHLRSIESLIANFPWRPGFDPYAIYPGGMNVTTGPFLDYAAASTALSIGLGDPSEELVRQVAAWFSPVFGALTVIPVFLLARLLAGSWAGLIAASWFAICPGLTAYYGKLGFADHHVFEALFYGLLLFAMAAGLAGKDRRWIAAAGVALGFALLNRPAAAFVGGLIGAWAAGQAGLDLWQGRSTSGVGKAAVAVLLIGWCFLIPAGGGAWGLLPHLAMAAGVGMALAGWLTASVIREQGWPAWAWPPTLAACVSAGLAGVWLAAPGAIGRLQDGFLGAIAGGEGRLIAETSSLLRMSGHWSLRPLLVGLGPAGFLAIPAFVAMGVSAVRERDRVLSLVACTGLAMYFAALLQARMSIYASVNLAIAVGWCGWRLLDGSSFRTRALGIATAVSLLYAPTAAFGIAVTARDNGMSKEWRTVTGWLRTETPEPLGDPRTFLRYYPRLAEGQSFSYPKGAYGVLAWWDFGYWVMMEGHRPPIANGTQQGAREAAAFFTSTDFRAAAKQIDALGAHYVVVDNSMPLIPIGATGFGVGQFTGMLGWTGAKLEDYVGFYDLPKEGGGSDPVIVFYPKYYRSTAMRLYLHDGVDYEPRNATTVFSLRKGEYEAKMISSQRTFPTYDEAQRYLQARPEQDLILGSRNPFRSCVPLEAVPGVHLVFNSTPGPVVGSDGAVRAVKVFERPESR